jgi:uncharacterized protein (TIGR03437 family)
MGPTTPDVPYGDAAPEQEPFARLSMPIACTEEGLNGQGVEVLFAGLAPAMVGIYQIDWRVPTGVAGPMFGMTCQFRGSSAYISIGVPVGASDGP